jgi:hypothetical protein
MISMGWVGEQAILTNNLFIDNHIAGADTDAVRQAEFGEPGELDPRNGLGRIVWILSVPNDTTQYKVANNFYSVSSAVQGFYDQYASAGVLGEGPQINQHVRLKLGADSVNAFLKESVTLGNTPTPMLAMAHWYRDPAGANKTKSVATFVRALHDYDRRPWQYYADTLDCTYPSTTAAFFGSIGRYPVGDLNWFPEKKALWEQGIPIPVGVDESPNTLISDYQLGQNYPNPFNPGTTIEYRLAGRQDVSLKVFNMLGQEVATLVNEPQNAGVYRVQWDGTDRLGQKAASGIYLFRFQAGDFVQTRKMLLMK